MFLLKDKKIVVFGIVFLYLLLLFDFIDVDAMYKSSKSIEGSILIPETNYCINNGFTTLSECMLIMDNFQDTVSASKSVIKSKNTPTFSKIAPTITYDQSVTPNVKVNLNTNTRYVVGDTFSFNASTGVFTLKTTSIIEANTSQHSGKYTCASTGTTCTTMYKILTDSTDGTTYKILTADQYTYHVFESFDSDNGLYFANDDYGESFYYRGSVTNNFVSYAGYIWRIVRQNGDGSVKLIYFGSNTSKGGNAKSSQFNASYWDPTYVGYMYNDSFSISEITSAQANYSNFNENSVYYFGKGYTYNEATKRFSLTGSVDEGSIISGSWKNVYKTVSSDKYIYTCFGTTATATCPVLMKIVVSDNDSDTNGYVGYVGVTTAKIQYLSYNSLSYEDAVTNSKSSPIKIAVDSWYEAHIKDVTDGSGVLYSDYLSNNIFCNDRSLGSINGNGDGFNLSPTTYYGAYYRLGSKKTPSLICPNDNDKFTIKDSGNNGGGNGALSYPIGLITADEVAMAGGVYGLVNPLFYLNYNDNAYFWTMSPAFFHSSDRYAHMWFVYPSGSFYYTWVTNTFGVRPVVNLKADVLITGGDGTAINPYMVSMSA